MKKMNLSATAAAWLSILLCSGCSGNQITSSTSGPANTTFSDVSRGEWYADHIQWGSNLGLIDGYPDGTFQPNKPLTRAEVVKVIRSLADKGYLLIPAGGTPPTPGNTTTISGGMLSYAFTQAGDKPELKLINVIDNATQSLDIAIYSLTHPDIVQAIKNAKGRGVTVRLITDKIQSSGKSQTEALKILGSAGIPTKMNTHSGLMHLKVTIADNKIATTGSYNYSKAASTTNDEVLVVIQDEITAKSFAAQFDKMWNDTSNFTPIEKYIGQGATAQQLLIPGEVPLFAE